MKKILIAIVFIFSVYHVWGKFHKDSDILIYEEPYIIVYGVERCPVCKKVRHNLKENELDFQWIDMDKVENGWENFRKRAKAMNMSLKGRVPFVEINGQMYNRPDLNTIIEKFRD